MQAAAPAGADHYAVAWRLATGAWIGCAILHFLTYLRPSPYGGPFLLEWHAYIIRPLVYDLLAIWLVSLPFFLIWLLCYSRSLSGRRWALGHWALAGLMAANLLLTAFDHELYRFLGLRFGPSFVAAYGEPTTVADPFLLSILAADRGGPFIAPLLCLLAPALYLWWAIRMARRRLRKRPPRRPAWVAAAILVLPLTTGLIGWSLARAEFRLTRLEPALFALVRDWARTYEDHSPPGDVTAFSRMWAAEWQAGSSDSNWRFPDPAYPFLRVPRDPARPLPADRWNLILIQLETLRGVDVGHLGSGHSPSPTPYLDALAGRADAAVYSRALSLGPPSINGIFAGLCSLAPTSRRFITANTHAALYCLPDALRRHGYRAEMFSASDTDMENSTFWIRRWFDTLWRYPDIGQRDREVFREAATRIRTLGRSGQPFFATLFSASNHHPFRSPEPALDIAGHDTPQQRILNTTRHTDDVVRELIEGLRSEPWFARTLIVIIGDHGYNLGEHGGAPGGYTLYRESVWVPLLIVGPHPRLPAGRHDALVTILDIAPTIADLIGLREANPWQGHSLLSIRPGRPVRFGFRESLLAEQGGWSAVTDHSDGRPRLYDWSDWLQRRDLAAQRSELARRLLDAADLQRRFNDYLVRQDRIWPRSPS
ncbi:LTA synthase family protein [Sphingosinicella sp.]|uniref:LTA synthase family protein n=1 Tax=Sphingosinicella sp. TaxID=1917971 RepID=UPI00403785D9